MVLKPDHISYQISQKSEKIRDYLSQQTRRKKDMDDLSYSSGRTNLTI